MPHAYPQWKGFERAPEGTADGSAQFAARGEDGVGIDIGPDLAGDVAFGRQRHRLGDIGGIEPVIAEDCRQRDDQFVGAALGRAAAMRGDVLDQEGGRERLHRLPAVERIRVAGRKEAQIVGRQIGDEFDRRRKSAIK